HDGSLSTGHANSSRDILSRLEMMVLMGMDLPLNAIRRQIVSGVDIIIHLGRLRDKSRRVLEIAEVDGLKDGEIQLNPLYRFEEAGVSEGKIIGNLQKKNALRGTQKLLAAGYEPLE
ncbi:MAG: CpaF family protein, partial [Agathobacter sp.]|nr:CpaF family protein [Agathobacter sp.]